MTSESKTTEMPLPEGVIAWLNGLEEISLSHGSKDLDNDLEMIVACRTYLMSNMP